MSQWAMIVAAYLYVYCPLTLSVITGLYHRRALAEETRRGGQIALFELQEWPGA